MPGYPDYTHPDIHRYALQFARLPHPYLARMVEADASGLEGVQPPIGPQVAATLAFLIDLTGATRALEFGTCLGYSTVGLAAALRGNSGHLTAVEQNQTFLELARRNLDTAGLAESVTLIHGDAAAEIERLDGPFDLILQDAAKPLYPRMLEACIKRLRVGGILAADDALFKAFGYHARSSDPIHAYNEAVRDDPRLHSLLLPIGDGLMLSRKR